MKRAITVITLVVSVGLVLTACGNQPEPPPTPPQSEESPYDGPTAGSELPLPEGVILGANGSPDVTGGGPDVTGGGGNDEAVARLYELMPDIEGDYHFTGQQALDWAGQIAVYTPALSQIFGKVQTVAGCALDYGVVGAKGYLTPDFTAAGAMVIVSAKQLEALPQIALQCFVSEVLGGGGGGWSPCYDQYWVEAIVNDYQDTFYVFMVGTNQETCAYFRSVHEDQFGLTATDF
jgi:hypothetical protein